MIVINAINGIADSLYAGTALGQSAMFAGLCLEEMAGNIITHGFSGDTKKHSVDIRVVYCRQGKNIGIRMIYSIADEVTYQNLLGMNVLTIKL